MTKAELIEAEIARLQAARPAMSREDILLDALRSQVTDDERARIREGIAAVRRGDTVDADAARARIEAALRRDTPA